jgi:hypothetical protein
MSRYCERCEDPLPSDSPRWKRLCLDCFKLSKQEEQDELLDEIQSLRRQNQALQLKCDEIPSLRQQNQALQRKCDMLAAQQKPAPRTSSKFEPPQDVVKKLILLCHPDHHHNSAVANEVTKYLLALRKVNHK